MYTEKVMDHFQHPRNVGELENASGVGTVGNAKCGDIMRIYLDIDENQIIRDVKFKTFGCGAAVATSSMATELVKGKNIQEAMKVTNKAVMEALDGLPPVKVHCSLLAEEAIHAALWDYAEKNGIKIEGLEKPKTDIHEDEEEEENTDPNRHDIDANLYGDEDFTNAVKKVEIGTASIQEYKKNGTTDTIALIYRMDPQQDRKDGKDFFTEKRSDIIYGAKWEEFDKEIKEYAATLPKEINDRAIKMCDPKNFEKE